MLSIHPSPAQPTLPAALDVALLAGQLAPASIALYQRDLRAYVHFANTQRCDPLTASTLARWRTELSANSQLSPNTINRMLSAVKRIMREAAAHKLIPNESARAFSQVNGVKLAALKQRIKRNTRTRIEPAEMRQICDSPDADELIGLRDSALLATLASSGLRVSEAARLTTAAIRARGSGYVVIVRGKNDVEARTAPLSREAHAHIQAWLNARPTSSNYLFTAFGSHGKTLTARPLSIDAIWLIVRKYAAAAGIADVKPHDFRRFVGTQLARKDIRQAQKALGHKRLETTARHYVLDELDSGLTDHLY